MSRQSRRYFGRETEAALRNFPFSVPPVHHELIRAIIEIKRSAARANMQIGQLDARRGNAIVRTCEEALRGALDAEFVTPSLQGGAGTSLHMNVNEVLAARASEFLPAAFAVHPNDHVNAGQSTNDVVPSALKIASIRVARSVVESVDVAIAVLEKKSKEFKKVIKLARTHLQDAIPTTLGAEFDAYADMLKRDKQRVNDTIPYLYDLNLGGTAIGNGLNASPAFVKALYADIKKSLELPLRPAKNKSAQTMVATDFCMLSGAFALLALDFSKIANDLRLLASGPRGGIGEISLPRLQAGSSIMPGKVNPVLLEVANQLYFLVSGNDVSIRGAAQAAQLELSVMGPLIADRLIASGKLIAEVVTHVSNACIADIHANEKRCKELLEHSTAYATVLAPKLGYDAVSKLVKEALDRDVPFAQVLREKGIQN